jgi:beta-lactamase class A
LAVKLRDAEVPAGGTLRRDDRRRAAGRDRRCWALQGFSVLLAFVGAGLVLLLVGGPAREQSIVGTVVQPVVEGPPPLPKAITGFDAEALRDRIEEIAGEHEGLYGVAVLEPVSGTEISLRGAEEFMGASIGKLPVFATLYRAEARGELDLGEEISILPEDVQDYGSGSLQAFPIGYSLILRECAYRLVNHSDNTAWAMLDRRLGEEKIRAELEDMGAENSVYSGPLYPYYTTPNDVLLLLEKISDSRFTSEELSDEMLDAMTDTAFEDRIPEMLPPEVRVAHKIGSYGDNFDDAGVIFYKDDQGVEQHYYLVVLTSGTSEYEARDAIQNMSLAVYEALTGRTGGDERSRG